MGPDDSQFTFIDRADPDGQLMGKPPMFVLPPG